jgi:hypothetical protein
MRFSCNYQNSQKELEMTTNTKATLALPDGTTEPRMPWPVVRASTTDDDLKAIYAYLHSRPPVDGPTK